MGELSEAGEVSFFELAWRLEMARGRPRRWRDRRDSLPARRRRRRSHRRDFPASREYSPMEVDANAASRGVRVRLAGAIASALVTVSCLLGVFLAPQLTLASAFALTIAVSSLGLAIALTMSARREELVHQLAGRLTREAEEQKALDPGSEEGDFWRMLSAEEEWVDGYDGDPYPRR